MTWFNSEDTISEQLPLIITVLIAQLFLLEGVQTVHLQTLNATSLYCLTSFPASLLQRRFMEKVAAIDCQFFETSMNSMYIRPTACCQLPPFPSPHLSLTESWVSKLLTCSYLTTWPLDLVLTTFLQTIAPIKDPSHAQLFPLHPQLSIHIQNSSGNTTAKTKIPLPSIARSAFSYSCPRHHESGFETYH